MKILSRSLTAILFLSGALVAAHADETKVLVNKNKDGLAIQGYDPVAYFTDHKPVRGSSRWQAKHEGAIYRFSSAEHLAQFQADPARYTPAYGGYCGYAASINRLSLISPEWFQILDGRLVLQHNQKAWDKWNADLAGNLDKADRYWPSLVQRNGTGGSTLVNVDRHGVALRGYDPVAYFSEHKPVRGRSEIEGVYEGAIYHFASQENRETFERDPIRYAPQYGGFCGYAVSINKVRPIHPKWFQIIDGRLVLQHTRKALDLWNQDASGNLIKADQNWPVLVGKKSGTKHPIDSAFAWFR